MNNTGISKLLSRPENLESFNEKTYGCNETLQQGHGNINATTVISNNKSSLCSEDSEFCNEETNDEISTLQEEQENLTSAGCSEERWEDIPILESLSPLLFQQALRQNHEDNSNVTRSLQQLLRMQAACNLSMKDIKQRLITLENTIKSHVLHPLDSDDGLIVQLLPLATIDNIKELESLLKTSNEAVTQLKKYILKIGGNNPRDNIHRTLKKIFTNECVINCSWKGIRNNFRLDNLHVIRIMRRQITSHHTSLTETEFNNIAVEWFRFAKQRKTREEKEKNKENENE